MLEQLATIVILDTILRWHRELVAAKWNYSGRRMGRPPASDEIVELVLRMARDNPACRYDRIQGALCNLGHEISDTTVASILKAHGVEPAPDRRRQSTWKSFLEAHWDVLASVDFHNPCMDLTSTVAEITGAPARTFLDWAADHAAEFRS
jgi:hypothetical protein